MNNNAMLVAFILIIISLVINLATEVVLYYNGKQSATWTILGIIEKLIYIYLVYYYLIQGHLVLTFK